MYILLMTQQSLKMKLGERLVWIIWYMELHYIQLTPHWLYTDNIKYYTHVTYLA
jgi:hypothetical protein